MSAIKVIFLVLLLFLLRSTLSAQNQIRQIFAKDSVIESSKPREKLYLHFDKPNYIIGDTIWFTAYLIDALTQKASAKSGIIYIELFDGNNGFVKRMALKTIAGNSFGQIAIDKSCTSGIYHLRAYTNWMQNFGDSLFFKKDIPIAGGVNSWLLQMSKPNIYENGGNDSIQLNFTLKDVGDRVLPFKEVGVVIQNKRGNALVKNIVKTDRQGRADINFYLPKDKVEDCLWLNLQNINKSKKITKISAPLFLKGSNNIDLQFLPESGHLVAGLPNKVAFKALDNRGKPIAVKGKIKNNSDEVIAQFSSFHDGMGFFVFTPKVGESYVANSAYSVNKSLQTALPVVENSGTVISVNPNNGKNIILDLLCTPDLQNQKYYLLAKSKGKVFWGSDLSFTQCDIHTGLAKKIFPTGVCSFQLFKANGQLVNERAFFVNNNDNLHISLNTPDSNNYTKDSIPLEVSVTNNLGQPVQGSFSLAITDDNKVSKNFNKEENILSYQLLTSDLHGKVNAPGYYFSDSSYQVGQALDALMLTQGFVKYNWGGTKFTYLPQPDFQITGKVINGFNKPVKEGKVSVVSLNNKRFIAKDTVTNKDGTFTITHFPNFDSASFAVQVQNKRGGSYGFGITLNKFEHAKLPDYSPLETLAANVNIDSSTANTLLARNDYLSALQKTNNSLEDVTVYTKAAIHNSKNLNGPGGYDTAFSRRQLQAMGDTTLDDILDRKFPQIRIQRDVNGSFTASIHGTNLIIIIDGVRATSLTDKQDLKSSAPRFEPIAGSLIGYMASDIAGMELMLAGPLTNKYDSKFLSAGEMDAKAGGAEYSYLEITTYGSYGPFLKREPGMEILRPQPFTYGSFFYMPRYVNYQNTESSLPDVRSTIFWFPQVLTNKEGNAKLYFYSAPNPSTYTIWLEGTDLKGSFGAAAKKIKIEPHP